MRTPALINAFVPDASTDFWGIFGDNFYDRTGEITTDVYDRVSVEAKMKFFATVPGNHDYWVHGTPASGTADDQCAHGHMQFYAQDAKAAEAVLPGSPAAPFNFSTTASGTASCSLPDISNAFWYNQLGNVGLVGQSGAYSLDQARPLMKEACAWLARQEGLEVALLFGHWDTSGMGASAEMSMPEWYTEMAALPGCDTFDRRGMLKFVMGHTHCNDPHPHGKIDTGFRVAGFGMGGGCQDGTRYGIPIVDTTSDRVRFWYFDASTDDLYDQVLSCVRSKGWRACTSSLAKLWLDQPIGASSASSMDAPFVYV